MINNLTKWILLFLVHANISFGQDKTIDESKIGSYDFAQALQSVPMHARLEQENWYVWGASVLKGDDEKYHMVYCRWPKDYPFGDGWLIDAQLCYATADNPTGPFKHDAIILKGMKYNGQPNAWDGASVYNPHLKRFNGKYYLYYTGTNDPQKTDISTDRNVLVRNQCIGVIEFNSFDDLAREKIKRDDQPLLKPLTKFGYNVPESEEYGKENEVTPANIVVVNPSVVQRPDGKYVLIFKGWLNQKGWGAVHGAAISDSPTGPFEILSHPIFNVDLGNGKMAMAEDPFIWYYKKYKAYFALVKDFHGNITGTGASLALFRSDDALNWEPAKNILASDLTIIWENGEKNKAFQLERPQLLLDDAGNPQVLYAACALSNQFGDRSVPTFNIYIPLKNDTNKQSWFSRALEYKRIAVQDDDWHIWGCSPIQDDEGKTHIFVARWPQKTGHQGWKTHSQIAHYVANHPEGPFKFAEVVLEGTKLDTWDKQAPCNPAIHKISGWDKCAPHNPAIHKVNDKYALFYIANNGLEGHPGNQKIGLLVSESLYGPWKKAGKDGLILSPPTDRAYYNCNANNGVNNPAFLHKDGKYLLYFKSNDTRNNDHWAPKMGLAIAENIEGPYIQNKEPITKNEQVIEDGYAFEYNGKVYLVTTDNHGTIESGGGLIWESEDGIHFNDEPNQAFSVLKNYLGDKIPETAVRTKGAGGDKFERPQVLMIEGKPAYIYMPSGTNVEGGKGSSGYVLKITIE